MGNTCNNCQNVDSIRNIEEVNFNKNKINFDEEPMLQNVSSISKGIILFSTQI